ncbi:uncharacterized protein LOC112511864 [Cynara cardunculus var. scolymus]|uniref:uncharacterized protein LOC112511864 n=1 Tax=Cynara cardunculus var. scolymus TaxID=59895 RepID=UPI000D62D717|nr:uncharacterized protein LOC112511864 [Cynara cardunculus var. scolymus]
MVATMVLASGNLMSSTEYCKRFLIARLQINKNITTIGFHGQPLHVGGTTASRQARKHFLVYSSRQPRNPPPPTSWQQWIFGLITTVIVPFFSRKWNQILKIKDGVDTVIEETEKIADCVEEVAETVDKVAKDVADHLPEGGQWRNAAVFVEGVAEEIAREAHLVEDFLDKVEEVEEKAELLFESVNDQTKNAHEDLNTR